MKKRILSMLLCLCMGLSLITVAAFAEETTGSLAITVDGFEVGNTPADCTFTFESTITGITFSAEDIQYIRWDKYAADGDRHPVTNNDAFQAGTLYRCVIDLDSNGLTEVPVVTVNGNTPDYCTLPYFAGVPEKLSIGCDLGTPTEPGSLAINVDGFQVGNTLADCTFTFESTIPGVTFSEDDIRGIDWEIGVFNGTNYDWHPIAGTEVFEADTPYQLLLLLNNKGLELAPSTTVNGNTPEYCHIYYNDGEPYGIEIIRELGTPPEPVYNLDITINGADVVCAQQDYEFIVTAAKSVTLDKEFGYDTGNMGGGVDLTLDDDGVGHGVMLAQWYDPNKDSFELFAHGYTADGTPIFVTKTVQVSPDHIFEDGVCGCGAKQQYTITYDGGEGVEGSIAADTKTHGVPVTLSSDTFTREGFVQTGWVDKEGAVYKLGGTYTADQDVTLYPVWEKLVTVTADFTTTVALGDAGEPGETTFELALIDGEGNELTFDGMYFGAVVTTDGAGDYTGTVTITATEKWLYDMLYEGAFIWQYDDEEAGWTYDDTVWGVRLYMPQVAARAVSEVEYSLLLYPTYVMENGLFNLDLNAGPVDEMTFTNTYTAHAYELNHDADGHWDECPGCKDRQNEEPHKYGEWTVTKEATETEEGEKERTCTVCDYTQTETIPVPEHTHVYEPKHNETHHWDECDCGDKQNEEAHKYGEWTVTKEATETEEGEKERTCTVCGYTQTAEIAKLPSTDTTKPTQTNPNTGATTSPKTGDNSHLFICVVLLFAGGFGVVATGMYSKRRRSSRAK